MNKFHLLGIGIGLCLGSFLACMSVLFFEERSEYDIRTMERSCVNCDLRMKEYKKVSEKRLEYYLSRFEFMKKYGLIDTMIIDTIH